MRFSNSLVPLAALSLSTAFVIPDEQTTHQIAFQPHNEAESQSLRGKLQGTVENAWSGVEEAFKNSVTCAENALDNALNAPTTASKKAQSSWECHKSMTKFDMDGWIDSELSVLESPETIHKDTKKPKKPHHPPHGPSNKTVYELIASSKYTTKLAKLINEYPDLVETLNGTAANYTVFAPIDKAFEKLPEGHKPSKELIKKVLSYHFSPHLYPAGRLFVSHTLPTALGEDALGGEPQRLRVGFGIVKGLHVNFYSRVVAINIFGSNGVVHGIDSLLLPPPPAHKIIELFPDPFSTLQLGLVKTGLDDAISHGPHVGGTLFAPTNFAFQKLGPKINAFLFSKYGQKYLKALLKYHIVANQTLYSDAFYKEKGAGSDLLGEVDTESVPKGHTHVDLPTLLHDKSLSIDIGRYGGFISIKINGFSTVSVQDGIAKDGVIQVVNAVLIPPKTPGSKQYSGEELSVEDLKDRLDVYVEEL